ncbi:hypothetical protein ACQBAR_13530 [Propionibacteriaceae bacterium Y1685]
MMREALLRLRVPMTVLLLAVSAFQTLLRLIWIGIDAGRDGVVAAVAGNYDYLANWVTALVITIAVGVCHLAPVAPAARRLAIAAGVVVGLQVVLSILSALITLILDDSSGAFAVFRLLFSFGEIALMIGVLIVLSRFVFVGQPMHVSQLGHGSQFGHGSQVGHQISAGLPTPGSQVGPGSGVTAWQPDQNSGAVWGQARQAAGGASATGWGGAPDQSGGWTPAPRPEQHAPRPEQHAPRPEQHAPRPEQQGPGGTGGWAPVDDQQHTRIADPRQPRELGQHRPQGPGTAS